MLRGGPADKAGVKPGDVLRRDRGQAGRRPDCDAQPRRRARAGHQRRAVKLKRKGQDVDASITVGRRPKPQAAA